MSFAFVSRKHSQIVLMGDLQDRGEIGGWKYFVAMLSMLLRG